MSYDNNANVQTLPGQRLYEHETYLSPFTVSDVRSLYNIAQTADDRQLAGIIGKHINHKVQNLVLHDFNYCMYWQRINSYPRSPMKITWTCPHCNSLNHSPLTSSSLVINNVDRDYDHGMQVPLPSFPDNSPKMRLQLVGDEEIARKFLREKKKVNVPDTGQLREAIVACLLSPEWPDLNTAYNIVTTKLTPDDIFTVQTFEELFAYGVQDHGNFSCKCGRESRVNFRFDLTQFFPADNDKYDLRDKILSLKSSKPAVHPDGGDGVERSGVDGPEKSAKTNGSGQGQEGSRIRGSFPPIKDTPVAATPLNQDRVINVPLDDFVTNKVSPPEKHKP